MRINMSSTLTADDVHGAVSQARTQYHQDIYVQELTVSPKGAITFYCASENGRFATNRRNSNGARAATWSAWGYVIAELYSRDPNARIGQYKDAGHFWSQCIDMSQREELAVSLGCRSNTEPKSVDFLNLLEERSV